MTTAEAGVMQVRILDAGAQLFVEQGYHGLSMREIAEAVGISKAGLYYHFQDKEQLFVAILNRCMDQLEAALITAPVAGPGVQAEVAAILEAIFAQPPHQRALMRLASSEIGHLSSEVQAQFGRRYYTQFIGRIEATLRGGVDRGELRALDPHLTTWILLGMAYPFFTPAAVRGTADSQLAIAAILRLFFEGALAD